MATAIALGPALAHLLELPNKINLPKDGYFIVQQIYAGWSLLGGPLALQFVAIARVVLAARDDRRPRTLAVQRRDGELDRAIRRLAGTASAMGIFAHSRRVAENRSDRLPHPRPTRDNRPPLSS